jgi:hypothetical protein
MAQGSRPPGRRQARRRSALLAEAEHPIGLGRLFSLRPEGRVTARQLEPLRACLVSASLELDALRFAAEDAVDAEPLMPPGAQHADVYVHGAALYEALCAAQDELDLLVLHLRQEVPLGS